MKFSNSNPFASILKFAVLLAAPGIGHSQTLSRTNVQQNGSLTNSSPITVQNQAYGIHFYGVGANGANEDDKSASGGGNAGNIDNFTNNSGASISTSSFGGLGYGIYLELSGGNGGSYTDDNANHNAGSGGAAGFIQGFNNAPVTATGLFSNGFLGIRASSIGGNGGYAAYKTDIEGVPYYDTDLGNSENNSDGQGGFGGTGGAVTLTNSGVLQLGTSGTPLQVQGSSSFEGLSAASRGGNAGYGRTAKSGAASGDVAVINSGALSLFLDTSGSSQKPTSLYGIFAKSVSGAGADSFTDKNSAGSGANSGLARITLNAGGDIRLSGVLTANPVSVTGAGMGAITEGGAGGRGFSGDFDQPSYGGRGGNAGPVGLHVTDASVTVSGDYLAGMSGISTGGRGGDGSSRAPNHSFSGNGGSAGAINADVTRTISGTSTVATTGAFASGIFASNTGGAGGNSYQQDGLTGGAAGAGGNGGGVGDIGVTLTATTGSIRLTTNGSTSHGIDANSTGGAGGNGGNLNVSTGQIGDNNSTAGAAGLGANSGKIHVTLSGDVSVSTAGPASDGIRAVALGGAGGNGGKGTIDFASSQGRDGGKGGDSGSILIELGTGTGVFTTGDSSSAISAFSLSGAGGAGGGAAVGSSESGGGGTGGNTGTINITNNGVLATQGSSSYGIFAHAFSGGGGVSGNASSPFSSQTGNGGASGTNGAITVNNGGQITTQGESAYGIFAQSLGGQGGAAGDSQLGIISLGGTGGTPSNGGTITLNGTSAYQVQTISKGAHGALLQSVGGGGGDGGSSEGFNTIGGSGSGGGTGGLVTANLVDGSTTINGDLAVGLLMQSVGGGGGNGGDSTAVSLFEALAIGGQGGVGGNGGVVNLNSSGNFTTSGSKSAAVLAQSIGGGGGNGGSAFSSGTGVFLASATAIGGNGVGGGDGKEVTLNFNGGQIRTGYFDTINYNPTNTLPVDAFGVLAQSIGGGGGNGGSAIANAMAISPPTPEVQGSIAVATSNGGSGGTGGSGGHVVMGLFNGTAITTQGQGSHGAIGQSIGGGGGNGGDSSSMAASYGYGRIASETGAVTFSLDVDVALGGTGGSGGGGGQVEMTLGEGSSAANIQTYGDYANGIQMQSIGGGGGNGGVGSGITQGYGSSNSVNVTIALGGTGGSGGNGGAASATVNPNAYVKVAGSGAHGVLVHSIGGGGGTSQGGMISFGADAGVSVGSGGPVTDIGASASVSMSLGATSGSGGNGGSATATVLGAVDTYGDDSVAVLAQSIGGGGGIAGSAGGDASADNPLQTFGTVRSIVEDGLYKTLPVSADKELELGSLDSGSSGNGGTASVRVGNYITTRGDWSQAVVAQSIGGGGGRGGVATVAASQSQSTLSMRVGGRGTSSGGSSTSGSKNTGTGSNGGAASVDLGGSTVSTGDSSGSGFAAYGVVIQSIGGGGGMAADGSDSNNGTISVGNGARTYQAPSYDPGGRVVSTGHQASDGVVSGNGGTATLTNGGAVITQGMAAHGLVLQSIGAGGGIGGAGTSATTEGASNIQLTVGGASRSTGHGGSVSIEKASTVLRITTNGDSAFGVLAQSIGGGGGIGVAVDPISAMVSGTLDSTGGTNRNYGGSVDLNFAGITSIQTSGAGSHGIVAQSIGGGGGVAGVLSVPKFQISAPASRSAYGNGGSVQVTLDSGSTLTTIGKLAHGIVAQSIGGGGGIFGANVGRASSSGTGSANPITLTLNGNISVTGEGSYGVFSQLDAPDINQSIGTTLNVGGNISSAGTAVYLAGGRNTVTVDAGGSIRGTNLLHQELARDKNGATFGLTTLVNNGTISGSISNGVSVTGNQPQLSLVQAALANTVSVVNRGIFLAGPSIQADIRNEGAFAIGENSLTTAGVSTRVEGDFVQSSEGTLVYDIDFSNAATDLLTITGDARLDGSIRANLGGIVANREVEVLRVEGNFANGLAADNSRAPGEYGIFDIVLRHEADRVFLRPVADFSPQGLSLSGNSRQLAGYLENIWEISDNRELGTLFRGLEALLGATAAEYDQALQQLSPGASSGFAANGVSSQQAFVDAAFGEKEFLQDSSKPVEVQTVWARTFGGAGGGENYDLDSYTTDLGAQWEISPNFFIGGALAYQYDSLDDDFGHVSGSGDTGMAAFTLKYEPGDWSFAAALTGSAGDFDTKRRVNIPGSVDVFEGSPSVATAGLVGRVGYTFHNKSVYIRPQATGSLVYVHSGSYTESGSSSARLSVDSESEIAFVFTPGFETGLRTDLGGGRVLRSYVSCGVSFTTGGDWEQSARFAGAPAGAGSFTTTLPRDTVAAQVTAGGQVQFSESISGYLEYQGQFADDANVNGGAIGIQVSF